MWQGWTKNLYPLMGGKPTAVLLEIAEAFPWLECLLIGLVWAASTRRHVAASVVLAWTGRGADRWANVRYGMELYRNLYPVAYIQYYVPGLCLYARRWLTSWWKNTRGVVALEGAGLSRKDCMIRITRKIEFCAAHFYHNPKFSAEENRRVFGKCNNPHGHGHNYVLEVTIAGEPDPTTGMVLDLKELKDILQRK